MAGACNQLIAKLRLFLGGGGVPLGENSHGFEGFDFVQFRGNLYFEISNVDVIFIYILIN